VTNILQRKPQEPMLAFEIALERLVFRSTWQRRAADFDFRKGGLLSIGMLVLLIARVVVGKLRGRSDSTRRREITRMTFITFNPRICR
jgi:hypothetical protein